MKQVVIKQGKIKLEEVLTPQPGPKEVLVQVSHSCISVGTERLTMQNTSGGIIKQSLKQPQKVIKAWDMLRNEGWQKTWQRIRGINHKLTPLGYSCTGIVQSIGHDIQHIKPGQRVACAGSEYASHAEWVCVPENLVCVVPDEVSPELAATTTLGAIAMNAVRRSQATVGEWAVVMGLGSIGHLVAQILNAAGVNVIGIEPDEQRRELLKRVCVSTWAPDHPDLSSIIGKLTQGQGVDVAFTVVSAATLESSTALNPHEQAATWLRKQGSLVIIGDTPIQLDRALIYQKELNIRMASAYGPGRYDPNYEVQGHDYPYSFVRWTAGRNMLAYLQLLANKRIQLKGLVQYPLEDVEQVFETLNSRNPSLFHILEYPTEHDARIDTRTQLKAAALPTSVTSAHNVIHWGIIGPGQFVSSVHLPTLKALAPNAVIHGLAAQKGLTLEPLSKDYQSAITTTDYRQLLDNPDIHAVLIGTRHNVHAEMVVQALQHGKAVFVEKPLALNLEEVEQIESALKQSKQPLMVGFNRRFAPHIQHIKPLLQDRIGPLIVHYRVNAEHLDKLSWVYSQEGGGRVRGELCHMLDLLGFLVDSPVEDFEVESSHANEDTISLHVRYQDGSLAQLLYTSRGSADLPKERIELFFDAQSIVIDNFQNMTLYPSGKELKLAHVDKGHTQELTLFNQYLQGHAGIPLPADEALYSTRLTLAVHQRLHQLAGN